MNDMHVTTPLSTPSFNDRLEAPRDKCRHFRLIPLFSLPIIAIIVWAGWQTIKPRNIFMPCVKDPWKVKVTQP